MSNLSHSSEEGPSAGSSEAESAAPNSSSGGAVPQGAAEQQDKSGAEGPVPASAAVEKPWLKFVGVEMEIALYTLVLGALGRWLDGRIGSPRPFATAMAGLVGFCFGMYRLVRLAIQSQSPPR